jgi:hypothetical protein
MKLGFSLPTAGDWATPQNQIRVARQAESLGYHSLWVFQRLLYALEPKNEYPPIPGKAWPKPFERVFDAVVTLAYVAAATPRTAINPRRRIRSPRADILYRISPRMQARAAWKHANQPDSARIQFSSSMRSAATKASG